MKIIRNYGKTILMTTAVFCFFAVITYLTPLAGDDWGYALNGMKGTPFSTAVEFYFSWSGRFFSELWGFLVAPNKWLWNILNPAFFTVIYFCLNYLANPKKTLLGYVVSFMLMLYASDYLRMETYTWIMGTTYVIPMMLCLVYLCIVKKYLESNRTMKWPVVLGCCVLNFYIGLCMENIAAVMILVSLFLAGYHFFNKKEYKAYVLIAAVSLVSFLIMRSSPGSAYRLSQNTAWLEMSLFEQIWCNVPYFLRYTFYDNKYLILVLNVVLCAKLLLSKNISWKMFGVAFVLSGITSFMLLSNKFLSLGLGFVEFFTLYETNVACQFVNLGIWVLYIIFLFVYFAKELDGNTRVYATYFLLMAGASNLVMLVSPIFGSRSSFYFYYFAILLVLLVLNEIEMKKVYSVGCVAVMCVFIYLRGSNILYKYRLVHQVQQDRLSKIEYYVDHPEVKDVWLPRMPIFTVHSADIEPEDTYHMDVFKQYYGLSSDCTIHFYWEEQ